MMKGATLIVAFATLVIGCGGPPSQLDSCHTYCNYVGDKCGATSDDVSACSAQCDQNKAQLQAADDQIRQHCSNADAIFDTIHNCSLQCDPKMFGDCAESAANACVQK